MLQFERINVRYGKNHVLKDVSLSVRAGEIVALIGANAAGKTTTLRAALGLKALTSGTLRLDREDITRASTPERVRRRLVLVPEGRQVFVKFTVTENLVHQGLLPPIVHVMIRPGTSTDGRAMRAIEYDTVSDRYPRFLMEEVLPERRTVFGPPGVETESAAVRWRLAENGGSGEKEKPR